MNRVRTAVSDQAEIYQAEPRRRRERLSGRRLAALRAAREVTLLAALWVAYSASRLLADTDLAGARRHAENVVGVERLFHVDVEGWVNHAASSVTWLAVSMSFWYAALHYVVTPLVLGFVFVRHPADYSRARNVLVAGSAIGLVIYVLLPTAPPRLMEAGYVDTLAEFARYGWWSDHASAPAGLGHITNELAAMPSLHVGWTVWVVWALWGYLGRRARALTVAYSIGTALVVLGTGNHWFLDAVAGAAVIAVGIAVPHVFSTVVGAGDHRRTTERPGAALL